jgi:hypothetical protein
MIKTQPLRGGSWDDFPRYCRSAARIHDEPGFTDYDLGFRVVCTPNPSLFPMNNKEFEHKDYIIYWEVGGYGKTYAEVSALNEDAALKVAYESWRQDAEDSADYGVIGESTEETRQDYLT